MALWGNSDNVGSSGTVSLNYATKVVTGAGTSFGHPTVGLSTGDVISFGIGTAGGTYFGDAVVSGITSFTVCSIAHTGNLSGAAIAQTDFQVSQQPKFLQFDPHYSERNSDYSTHVYGVAAGGAGAASGTQYETGVGWVGVQTYMGSDGNMRVKKEILCAMSGITTGNTPSYPNIAEAN